MWSGRTGSGSAQRPSWPTEQQEQHTSSELLSPKPTDGQGQARELCQGRPSCFLQQSTVCAPCPVLHTSHPAKHPPACTLRDPRAPTRPQPRQDPKGGSRAHLHIAEVVSCIAAVPRVHQHCIESICDGVTLGLRHVWADVQELRVSHVLWKEDVSGAGMAFLPEQEQLCCAMSPISCGRGRTWSPQAEIAVRRCQDEPSFPH